MYCKLGLFSGEFNESHQIKREIKKILNETSFFPTRKGTPRYLFIVGKCEGVNR
jgi:hypothetical protein